MVFDCFVFNLRGECSFARSPFHAQPAVVEVEGHVEIFPLGAATPGGPLNSIVIDQGKLGEEGGGEIFS